MSFLKDTILNHPSTSLKEEGELEDPLCIFLNDSQSTQSSCSSDEVRFKTKNNIKEVVIDNVADRGHKQDENVDDDKLFLLSLVPLLKQVPLRNKLNVRMDIMQCISDYTGDGIRNTQKQKKP